MGYYFFFNMAKVTPKDEICQFDTKKD